MSSTDENKAQRLLSDQLATYHKQLRDLVAQKQGVETAIGKLNAKVEALNEALKSLDETV